MILTITFHFWKVETFSVDNYIICWRSYQWVKDEIRDAIDRDSEWWSQKILEKLDIKEEIPFFIGSDPCIREGWITTEKSFLWSYLPDATNSSSFWLNIFIHALLFCLSNLKRKGKKYIKGVKLNPLMTCFQFYGQYFDTHHQPTD